MAYWDWPAENTHDNSHVVLAVHGLTRTGRDFDVLAQHLSTKARVICPDIVGRGRSDWLADPQGYQIPAYVGDMLSLMGQLVQEAQNQGQPISQLDWVGTSMGGLIGLGFVTLPGLPIPVGKLVLNDVGPVIEWSSLMRIGQYLGKSGQYGSVEEGAAYLRSIAAGFGPHTDAQWLALSQAMFRQLEDGSVTTHYDPAIAVPYQALTQEASKAGEATLWSLYDQVSAKTLLLRGKDSDLLSVATAAAMAARGPRAQVVEFAGVGHAPTLVQDDQVEAVVRFLLDTP
ncbi:alpha/beta hydrolase [Lampropedia puyangensis]|uniref:Alpha/beta hydrolase n=2 Tax=Lampropedia puyangensis TaxID=1330072 RepID=A0A4S8F677_9BURK|nr:alpha/beta hydrolase [Lampropedia puyangensis]